MRSRTPITADQDQGSKSCWVRQIQNSMETLMLATNGIDGTYGVSLGENSISHGAKAVKNWSQELTAQEFRMVT